MQIRHRRRDVLAGLSAAGAAGLLGAPSVLAREPPPEVTTIRLPYNSNICLAPQFVAEDLLRAEGFADIRYIPSGGGLSFPEMAGRGEIDFALTTASALAYQLDAGVPVTALAGIHAGCYELFVREPVQVVRDLRGRSIGIAIPNGAGHQLMSIIAAYIGLDPRTEIDWIAAPDGKPLDLFVDGKVDAFLAFPPEPQELRARGIGRVILSTATDKPWSQYFCCMLFSGRDFVDAHPVATKRALRAILKATEMCSADPEWTARQLVEGGFTDEYDYALQTVAEIRYDQWREFDPEDSLRFYALRLHELGMITSTPARIIADGTDWRFLDELKRELKT